MTLLAMVVGACTQQGGGPTTSGGAGQADPNGELVTNMGSEPDTIDPQVESFVQEIGVTMKVYEALMTFDIKTGKPIPAAAKDQPKVSADGKTYTYTLRDGLKYSDGSPLTTSSTDGSASATRPPPVNTRSPATSSRAAASGTRWTRRRTIPRSSRQRRPRS
jgi:ABC-type transport system substrate-binding protein